ncbi:hypothetical protein ACFSGX_03875 [Sphingomonas arantia]|uniref:Tail sheath protein Gp18-like domain-containing protein n=1 Tax=Sphingomonas arantia TaxID=1460676 RepID=A0ABW4TTA1_9SPHN
MAYQHGITVTELSEGARALVTVATAVVGLIATGPAADATVFPLDTPVLVTDLDAAIGKAGVTGTLLNALRAIADGRRDRARCWRGSATHARRGRAGRHPRAGSPGDH